jgi:hypothetical protein
MFHEICITLLSIVFHELCIVPPIEAKWDKWIHPNTSVCIHTNVIESYYFEKYNTSTLEECKVLCEKKRDEYGYGCSGIIVNELTGDCWVSNNIAEYIDNYITQCASVWLDVGANGELTSGQMVDSCVSCDGSLRLQYWNLTEPSGIEI